MTSKQRRLGYGLAIAAIIFSVLSLFVLLEFGATHWTTPLNVLSLVLIVVAVKARGTSPNRG